MPGVEEPLTITSPMATVIKIAAIQSQGRKLIESSSSLKNLQPPRGQFQVISLDNIVWTIWAVDSVSLLSVSALQVRMRSRCSTAMEGPDDGQINHVTQPTKAFPKEEGENTPELVKRKMKVQREEKEGKSVVSGSAKRPQTTTESSRGQKKAAGLTDLSKEDLLRLLGVMEGEVQVRGSPITLCCCALVKSSAIYAVA